MLNVLALSNELGMRRDVLGVIRQAEQSSFFFVRE